MTALLLLLDTAAGQAAVRVASELTDVRVSRAGGSYEGSIVLHNTGTAPGEVKLYQTDYGFRADGSNEYGPPGQSARSNADWIQLASNQLRLDPGEVMTVGYRVRVPNRRDLSGTYWSMVMIEPISPSSREAAEPLPERTVRLKQIVRFGLQVITEIGDRGKSDLAFANARLLEEADGRRFAVDAENRGQRWIRAQLWLELYTADGAPVGKFDGPKKRLFPGTSARFDVNLGDTPPGKYIALVVADGGGDNLFGANVELEVLAADSPRPGD